eukprot:2460162-Rhodomonas_salina.1
MRLNLSSGRDTCGHSEPCHCSLVAHACVTTSWNPAGSPSVHVSTSPSALTEPSRTGPGVGTGWRRSSYTKDTSA